MIVKSPQLIFHLPPWRSPAEMLRLMLSTRESEFWKVTCLLHFPAGSGAVHLIVSNPPYIGSREIETVDQQVKDYEPEMALFSGEFGIDMIGRLVAESSAHLLPGGYLIFETSPIIMDQCVKLVEASPNLEMTKVVKDFDGKERVVVARKA